MKNKKRNKLMRELKPFNSVIQICPVCNKIDVYKGDNHDCNQYAANADAREHMWSSD